MDAKTDAYVVADSVAPSGVRLTTMIVRYPNIIKQDLWTHRSISKNTELALNLDCSRSTNSNRAIPTRSIIREIWREPFVPTRFPKRSKSMHSAAGYHTGLTAWIMRQVWLKDRYLAIMCALLLQWLGCHKQIANRLLDQWQMTNAVFTAVDEWWLHFFNLRDHYAAQDEVQDVAGKAHRVYLRSEPKRLKAGEWHLPFIYRSDNDSFDIADRIKISVARCARLSYAARMPNLWAPTYTPKEDIALHDRLVIQTPEHAGPREHQAMAMYNRRLQSGNFYGWTQLRHSKLGELMRQLATTEQVIKLAEIDIHTLTSPQS